MFDEAPPIHIAQLNEHDKLNALKSDRREIQRAALDCVFLSRRTLQINREVYSPSAIKPRPAIAREFSHSLINVRSQ